MVLPQSLLPVVKLVGLETVLLAIGFLREAALAALGEVMLPKPALGLRIGQVLAWCGKTIFSALRRINGFLRHGISFQKMEILMPHPD
jgi:hypothetical protein